MKALSPANGRKADSFFKGDSKYPIKVAIVDDEENDRTLMTRGVNQSPDLVSVGSYNSGVEALKGIPSSDSEIVLMDVRMPGMSGIDATKRLKEIRPSLFIFLITGFDDPHRAAEARKAGADAYLTKPFCLTRFCESLTVCLRRRRLESHAPRTRRDSLSGRDKGLEETASAANSAFHTSDPGPGSAAQRQAISAEQEQGLLAKPAVRKALLHMVIALEDNFHSRQDLMQEAFVYFLSRERQYPGRALSWYLQAAKFHLKNLRKSGRSLDSAKRCAAQAMLADNCSNPDEPPDLFELGDDVMSEISARDIYSALLSRLEPIDRTILVALEEGWPSREVAKRLRLSYESVRRHRHKVAAVALKLGIVPLMPSSDHKSNPL